jgi:hypothetical protein
LLSGHHHLWVAPRTTTGLIRTTVLITIARKETAVAIGPFEMATVSIGSRHEDSSMTPA